MRMADFSFFSIWFSVFVKNTSGCSVLVPNVVFGFSFLFFLFGPVWLYSFVCSFRFWPILFAVLDEFFSRFAVSGIPQCPPLVGLWDFTVFLPIEHGMPAHNKFFPTILLSSLINDVYYSLGHQPNQEILWRYQWSWTCKAGRGTLKLSIKIRGKENIRVHRWDGKFIERQLLSLLCPLLFWLLIPAIILASKGSVPVNKSNCQLSVIGQRWVK